MKLTGSAEKFLAKALGSEGFEELQKSALLKPNSNKVLDLEELRVATQIVPRAVLSFLHKELSEIPYGGNKEIKLPVDEEAYLTVTKHDMDMYSGEIRKNNKVVAKFIHRSLPGVGLVVMSTFELYDIKHLPAMEPEKDASPTIEKIQQIIDERLGLNDLIRKVVDQRITEREAIDNMIRLRLTQIVNEAAKEEAPADNPQSSPEPEMRKLKKFLQDRQKKKKTEFKVTLEKNETVKCRDCGQNIFVKGAFSGCICYGDDRNNKVYIKKSENGVTMRFPKSWDQENIQMLLETLRNKNRGRHG